jgi:hypothetical protein
VKSWFEGDFAGFKRHLGNAYFKNITAYITRDHEHKKNKWCEGIPGIHEAHNFAGNIEFSHPYGKETHDILKALLEPHTDTNGHISVDVIAVEKDFIQIHKKMIVDGSCKFLCPPANKLWGSKPPALPGSSAVITSPEREGELNIEKLQVELIFSGLNNAQVLEKLREVFPGRGSMNTVSYYRTHLKNDKDPKWERLRAGRSGAAIPRG